MLLILMCSETVLKCSDTHKLAVITLRPNKKSIQILKYRHIGLKAPVSTIFICPKNRCMEKKRIYSQRNELTLCQVLVLSLHNSSIGVRKSLRKSISCSESENGYKGRVQKLRRSPRKLLKKNRKISEYLTANEDV